MLDIFNKSNGPLAERARSPLYGSFIISWIIWNWKIPLTVFYFSKEDFGGLNLVQYISTMYLNIFDCVVVPLIFSLAYMLIIPWIDYFLVWHYEINKRVKNDRKIAVGRKHFVDGNLYYDLRFKYDEEKNKILNFESELASKQNEVTKAEDELKKKETIIKELQGEITESATKKHEFERRINILEKRRTLEKIFNGRWLYKGYEHNAINKIEVERDIFINRNLFYEVRNRETTHLYDIDLIDVDEQNMTVNFVKLTPGSAEKDEITSPIIVCKLDIISDDLLEGRENNLKVTYTKRKLSADDSLSINEQPNIETPPLL